MDVRKVPVSVSIVKKSDPEFRTITTIDDVLSRIPGVYVDRSRGLSTTGGHTKVSLRGVGTTDRTLILKDGIPLNNSYTGGVSIWNSLSFNTIAQVEVVRGAVSSLYGSNAMGGVINMITEKPTEKLLLDAGIKYGSLNMMVADFKVGKRLQNGLGFVASAEYKQTDGYVFMHDTLWKDHYHKPANKLFNANLKTDYHFQNSDMIEFSFDLFSEHSDTGTSTIYDAHSTGENFLLRYKTFTRKVNFDITAYTNFSRNRTDSKKWNAKSGAFDKNYYISTVPFSEKGIVGKANHRFAFNNVTLGVDARLYDLQSEHQYHEKGISSYSGRQVFASLFVNDEITVTDHLNISAGVRYDYWKNMKGKFFDDTSKKEIDIDYPARQSTVFSPKLGLVYRPVEMLRLRTSFSTGFKAPSLYSLYRSAPHGVHTFDLGNPDLKPEKMKYSFEVGADLRIDRTFELSATCYQSQFKDFQGRRNIDKSALPSYFIPGEGVVVRQSINIGQVRLRGVETSVRYALNDCFKAVGTYTWSKSKILEYEIDKEVIGKELQNSPNHLANIGVLFDHPKLFALNVWYKYTGSRYTDMKNKEEKRIDGYGLVNMSIAKSFLHNRITAYLSVDNLFNKRYYGYYSSSKNYYYGPSRSLMGGLTFKL